MLGDGGPEEENEEERGTARIDATVPCQAARRDA